MKGMTTPFLKPETTSALSAIDRASRGLMSLDAAFFRRTNRVLLSMSVPANRLTTSGKFVIDFSLRSLYNVSIKYLWFALWQTK